MIDASKKTTILVWDAPVRVFHWLMVLSFAGAYLTAESERWRLVHVSLGYTMAGLLGFRILWGLVGTTYARFSSFVRGPAAVARYVSSLLSGKPEHHVGHNPAGAVAIVLLLLLSSILVASGWTIYNDLGGHLMEELHEGAAGLMLAVVGVHLAGVATASWLHGENLARAMVTGKKQGAAVDGIRRARRPLAILLVAAVLGFWCLQWQSAPTQGSTVPSTEMAENPKRG